MNSESDTIAAIATAPGEAGISIVRISGPESLSIADKILVCKAPPPSQRSAGSFVHGFVRNDGLGVDEVIVLIYRAPHSYTRQDVVELQGHGGRISAQRVLRTVLNAGARPAEPGEFTKRAFLNGRIDLLQAEAVADLIQARSDRAAQTAIEQLEGALSARVTRLYDNLVGLAADVEVTLDFTVDELPEATTQGIKERLKETISEAGLLLATWEEGHLLREGALVVISGSPNVGKSTLLNALLGSERSIVADMPGTTRDVIEEQLILDGVPLRLVDTAGLRETECVVEREGVRRARASIQKADLNLHVLDSSRRLSEEDRAYIVGMSENKCIIIFNKSDLGRALSVQDFQKHSCVQCCLTKGIGVEYVKLAIGRKLKLHGNDTAGATISERHRKYIQNALNVMNEGSGLINMENEKNWVLVAQLLRTAIENVGEITGRSYNNEVLDNVFERFCTGK